MKPFCETVCCLVLHPVHQGRMIGRIAETPRLFEIAPRSYRNANQRRATFLELRTPELRWLGRLDLCARERFEKLVKGGLTKPEMFKRIPIVNAEMQAEPPSKPLVV